MEDMLYTIDEAAQLLKVKRVTIYRWMSTGKLPYVTVGSRRRITREAILAFIKSGADSDDEDHSSQKDQEPDFVAAAA